MWVKANAADYLAMSSTTYNLDLTCNAGLEGSFDDDVEAN